MLKRLATFFSLFTSFSTLICCALPALFVTLGLGAAVAGLVSRFPQLIWMSEHKAWFFVGGGVMLFLAGIAQYKARNLACPIDPEQAKSCDQARRLSKVVYGISVAIYCTGAFFAFGSQFFL